jgi:hypothetical protein
MRILRFLIGAALAAVVGAALGDPGRLNFAEAKKIWDQAKNRSAYQVYASEFAQFNNRFHLDERGGCRALGKGPVELMLVIRHNPSEQFARIEQVLANVDNEKARCFQKSYSGVSTKVPPFLPFVLQMTMG